MSSSDKAWLCLGIGLLIIYFVTRSKKLSPTPLHESTTDKDMEEAEEAVDKLCNTLNIRRHSDLHQDD